MKSRNLYKSVAYETSLWGNIFNMSDMIIISIEIICYILLSSLIRAHEECFHRADFLSFTIETSSMNYSSYKCQNTVGTIHAIICEECVFSV